MEKKQKTSLTWQLILTMVVICCGNGCDVLVF